MLGLDKNSTEEELLSVIHNKIEELEQLIKGYGSFNIICNSILRNSIANPEKLLSELNNGLPVVQEYLALLCLKFPFSMGIRELTNTQNILKDYYRVNKIAEEIIYGHFMLQSKKFEIFDEHGNISDIDYIAQMITSEETLIRNETFEEHHWERLETLYEKYNEYFKTKLGFDVNDAIDFCIIIQEYLEKQITTALIEPIKHSKLMYDEVRAFKYRGKKPANFYPPEYLERYRKMSDEQLKHEFDSSMMSYTMTTIGHFMSFTSFDIISTHEIDSKAFNKFLEILSIRFEEIRIDFSVPEIIHPLKERPILQHEDRFLCSSLNLLDYSLDKLFAKTLLEDKKKIEKYKLHRHDYLLDNGMKILSKTLNTDNFYYNLTYPGGELDGIIFLGSNVFYIEAKAHQISDRAKKGYYDRIKNHIEDIVKDSHFQAIRTHQYLEGNKAAEFKRKNGSKVIIDGTQFSKSYFISLTLENFKAVSTSLKTKNTFGLFDPETFPWIVSLYDLKVVCEHMEGPSYLIQYMHRRKEFFKLDKFIVSDELDILAYYLKQDLRFDDILKNKGQYHNIQLGSYHEHFNLYYSSVDGRLKKVIPKMKHFTLIPVKEIISVLEVSGLQNSIEAAILILEGGVKFKNTLLNYIRIAKKKFNKDSNNHDFRMAGKDISNGKSWMLSYWIGFDSPEFIVFFESNIKQQFKKNPVNDFYALLDIGKSDYNFIKVLHISTTDGVNELTKITRPLDSRII